jgi:hypothetical protein
MSLKLFGLLAPVALGGLWFSGALGGGAYSRDVDRSPAQVMAALGDLDIREQPGEPGTDPSRAGGVAPLFRTERGPDKIVFVVMSGNQVATRMTAHLEPLDGGRRTRVTAEVERGDAPDDFVSPAFRSEGVTLGLFSLALEGELDALVAPPQRSRADCIAMEERMLAGAAPTSEPQNLKQAVGSTAGTAMRLGAIQAELRRQGCPEGGPGGPEAGNRSFMPPTQQMTGDGGAERPRDGARFEAGRPMVDVSRGRRH